MKSIIAELERLERSFHQTGSSGTEFFICIAALGIIVTFIWMRIYKSKSITDSLIMAAIWGIQVGAGISLLFMIFIKILCVISEIINSFCVFWLS